jgi:hypothetical protein
MSRWENYRELSKIRTYTYYDYMFKVAAYQFFGGDNKWALRLKAQGIQESGLTMTTNVGTGAYGVMQVMPATFQDLTMGQLDPCDSYNNIMAGAAYMARLYYPGKRIAIRNKKGEVVNQFKGFAPLAMVADDTERWKFALAGYNCGIGHITGKKTGPCVWGMVRAKGGNVALWDNCAPLLRLVTGDANARQTLNYVSAIVTMAKWMEEAGEQLV